MNLGDLGDSLLNLGKEKAKDMADQVLGEHAEGGGIAGSVAGFGKDMLDKDRKSTRLNSSHGKLSRMPSSA